MDLGFAAAGFAAVQPLEVAPLFVVRLTQPAGKPLVRQGLRGVGRGMRLAAGRPCR
jgi:hypothetical protein